MVKDYYQILELSYKATMDDVRASYRRLAVKYHPDLNNGSKISEDKFKELHEAYFNLSDPGKRNIYDQKMGYSSGMQWSSNFNTTEGFFDKQQVPKVFLNDFIGQEKIISNLRVFITAAKRRGEALEHTLVTGESGYGKSTLAYAIANELNTNCKLIRPLDIPSAPELAGILTSLAQADVLILEGFELLRPSIADFLIHAMSFTIPIAMDEGRNARVITLDLPHFTLIAVVNDRQRFKSKYRSHFGVLCNLEPYSEANISKFILKIAHSLGIDVDSEAATILAAHTGGNPKESIHLLKRVRDFSDIYSDGKVNRDITYFALKSLGLA